MKIALCFSGQLRDFNKTYPSLHRHILSSLKSHSVYSFAHYAGTNSHSSYPHTFHKVIAEEVEPDFAEFLPYDHDVAGRPWHKGSPLTAYLRQLRSLSLANSLRNDYEVEYGFTFDWVFRLRFDNLYVSPLETLSLLAKDSIFIPAHDNWRGFNDRFAFGPASLMDIYANRLDSAMQCIRNGYSLNPEIFLLNHLRDHCISVSRTRLVHHLLRYSQLWRARFRSEQGDDLSFLPRRPFGALRDKISPRIGTHRYDNLSVLWWQRL